MASRIKKHHIALLVLLCASLSFYLFYLKNDLEYGDAKLRPYETSKDYRPLVKLINDNMFWVSEHPDLSAENVLTFKAPSHDMSRAGQVTIDVIEAESTTAGFIAYYKKSHDHGFIWLLAVDKNFRGRGFGERLVARALKKLNEQNSTYVTLAVRNINKPAISLYKKMGFVEQTRDDERGIVTMIKRNL
jgi:ribosomal protein S18 acetylase RimI-like enzyme